MRASEVLQRWMGECWAQLDVRVVARLLGAVDALVLAGRLTLMSLARCYGSDLNVPAALKALDRLLSNKRLQLAREALYRQMWALLWPRARRVVLVVDWSVLKRDESLHLLRAAVPMGGRTLTVWEEVHPQASYNKAAVHEAFLARLRRLLPVDQVPILVTDAGFKVPWFRAAEALGFACIGRLRGLTQVRPVGKEEWWVTTPFHELPYGSLREGVFEVGKGRRHRARLVVYKAPPKGRKSCTVKGRTRRSSASRQQARSGREAWVLVVSQSLAHLGSGKITQLYGQRMQIEQSFRDLKGLRYGSGLNASLTRKPERLAVLLLLHALASMVAWLRGQAAIDSGESLRLLPHGQARRRKRLVLSAWRTGWEFLKRRWPPPSRALRLGFELPAFATARIA